MPTPDVASTTSSTAESADVSSATSFEADVANLFGDYSAPSDGGSPEPESTSAAGTTPAEPATGTDTETASDPAAAGDATTTAASDGTTPDTPPATGAADADPFADTTPATFMVNGVSVTNEDIRVFKEGGAVIRPEALPNVLSKLSERESLQDRNHRQSQEYQTFAKVVEWTDPSTNKTYSGPEAAIEMRIGNASLFAENALLMKEIVQSENLESLLTTKQVADGRGALKEVVVFRPEAIDALRREYALQQREITATIRDHYRGVMADASKPQPAPINYEAETPKLLTALAADAKLDASLLTAEDRKQLADLLPEHTKDGLASVKWQNLAKSFMRERAAQKANASQLVTSTQAATKEGLARMAAAARGVRAPIKPSATARVIPEPKDERASNEGEAFDLMLNAGASALRQRA
jgi:hypothetical protein